MQEAGELAKNTSILMNVSEFDDVGKATDTLISSLQAFKKEGQDVGAFSMEIIDKYNEVGNNYAISTSDLAESLTRSSAALVAANNSLEQSIAMTAAANTTIQDPESVGNALKVVSMRIRGVKTELEEAGEDTEGMVENTAKLQEKIMALTNIDGKGGINILTESGDFKSTYDILLAISKVWKDMDDASQAALLELVAGKTRGSVVAALFQNGDVLEDAYESASNASGSAMNELDTYLDSIQGRIDLFNNSVQTMWMNFIDSDVVKFIVDLGTAVIKLVDTLGLIPSVVGVFSAFKLSTISVKKNLDIVNKAAQDAIAQKQAAAAATQAETAATQIHTAVQEADIAATQTNTTATEVGTVAKETNTVAEQTNTAATEAGTVAELTDTAATEAGTVATQAETAATISATAATKALAVAKGILAGVGKGLLIMAAVTVASKIIGVITDAIDKSVNRVKYLKEEVEELKNTYKETKEELDDNLKTLTTSSDTDLHATLEDEFAALARGVDKYGNNISLTSDQYERYKEICEQIVGINPKIVAGYDSAAKAIGNNVGILQQLIELQRMQQRQNVRDMFTDENMELIASEAYAEIQQIKQNIGDINTSQALSGGNGVGLANILYEAYDWNNVGTKDYGDKTNLGDDLAKLILETLGMTPDEIDAELKKFYNEHGYWQNGQFINAYADIIYQNASLFPDMIQEWAATYGAMLDNLENEKAKLEDTRDILIDELLQVPFGQDAYYKLNNATQNVIVEWIKNSEIFKIDPNATEEEIQEQLKKNKELIEKLINDFADTNIQQIIEGVDNLDTSSLTAREHLDAIRSAATEIWNAIGGENNEYGFKSTKDIEKMLGLDIDAELEQLDKVWDLLSSRLNIDREDILNQFNYKTMTREQMQAFLGIPWDQIGAEQLKSASDVWNLINSYIKNNHLDAVKTYSAISSEVDAYNEILAQTREIISDNTVVTEDYKNALIDLVGSETEVNKCFDENNKLVVKDAAALRKLVAEAKKTKQATISMAKAQAQLQYRELVEQMGNSIVTNLAQASAYDFVADAVRNNIELMEDQIEAIEETIQQYSLLELSLSDAASAYGDYERAKERDAQMAYDDSLLEMLKTIDEGILNNETGTEAFEYAVKAIVPEKFWKDIDDADAKIKAIHDYIDGDPVFSNLFHVDEESGELDINTDNVRWFVERGTQKNDKGISVFDGSSTDFSLTDDMKDIGDIAEFYGITETAALALLTALEKVDAKWGDILTQINMTPFERDVYATTKTMAELNAQLANGSIDAATYAEKMALAKQQMAEYTKMAKDRLLGSDGGTEDTSDDTLGFIELNKQVAEKQEEVTKATEEMVAAQEAYNQAKAEGASVDELMVLEENLNRAVQKVEDTTEAWAKLVEQRGEYPDEQEISLVIADIDKELEKIGPKFDAALNQYFKKDANGYYVPIDASVNLDELEKTYPGIKKYIELCNTKTEIQAFADTTSAEADAKALQDTVDGIINAIEKNLITLDLDEEAVKNIVEQANKILEGIGSNLSIDLTWTAPWSDSPISIGTVGANVNTNSGAGSVNGTANADGSWGAPRTETSLVGELGPEILVRNGRWTTVGDNGAEFTQVKKGDIIFNHKQTEDLLSKGYVTGRGKIHGGNSAFASGTAYYDFGIPSYHPNTDANTSFSNGPDINNTWDDATSTLSDALGDAADSVEEFEETMDWIAIRMEEFDERIGKLSAELENITTYAEKNAKIDEIIAENQKKRADAKAGAVYYEKFAEQFLVGMNDDLVAAAKNGAIAINEFVKEQDEATIKAIQNYRDYAQKAADLYQQAEEILTDIRDSVIQKIDNIQAYGDAKVSLEDAQITQLQNAVDLMETSGNIAADTYYEAMMKNSANKKEYWAPLLADMQAEFDKAVQEGRIIQGSIEWYDQLGKIYEAQAAIDEATIELEEFQNAINDIYWDNFDKLIDRLDAVNSELSNLFDLLSEDDKVVDEFGNWTDEGITSLGLLAQQMENAQAKADQYSKAIKDLDKDYANGKYSLNEYNEKMAELKDSQLSEIKNIEDLKDAMVDINKVRIDAVKEAIDKEIEALEEKNEKIKESLDLEKEQYGWQKSVSEKEKSIADMQRRLNALAGDASASAIAERRKLQAELSAAQKEMDDMWYEHSIEEQQKNLDDSLENYKENKEDEKEALDKWLEEEDKVIQESFDLFNSNVGVVSSVLSAFEEEHSIKLSEAVTDPWKSGIDAMTAYRQKLAEMKQEQENAKEYAEDTADDIIDSLYEPEIYVPITQPDDPSETTPPTDEPVDEDPGYREYTVKSNDTLSGIARNELGSASRWPEIYNLNKDIIRDPNLIYSGQKIKLPHYAKGTMGAKSDHLAILDELGPELQFVPDGSGRLSYIARGTSVVPHDLSEKIIGLALDPAKILEESRPEIGAPHITTNNLEIDLSFGSLVHVDHCDQNTLPDLQKMVRGEFDNMMKAINQKLKRK